MINPRAGLRGRFDCQPMSSYSVETLRCALRLAVLCARRAQPSPKQLCQVMEGTAATLRADAWLWCLVCPEHQHCDLAKRYAFLAGVGEGHGEPLRHLILSLALGMGPFNTSGDAQGPLPRAAAEKVSLSLEDARNWPEKLRTEFFRLGFGSLLMAKNQEESALPSVAAFLRRDSRNPFTKADERLLETLYEEVGFPLLAPIEGQTSNLTENLSPRLRLVLTFLLEGASRKRIAEHLGIKETTVCGYVKKLYRHFGVNSQPELMSQLASRTH